MYFEFTSSNFKIKDQKTGKTTTIVSGWGDLQTSIIHSFFCPIFPKSLWRYLACLITHPHYKISLLLHSMKNVCLKNPLFAQAANQGKAASYISHTSKLNLTFSKIHCDLQGPSLVTSVQELRYYVALIDDSTRFTRFYPLCKKTDFYDCFLKFQKMFEN